MKISRGRIWSRVIDCTQEEADSLVSYLCAFEQGRLIDDGGTLHSGVVQWLSSQGFDIEFELDEYTDAIDFDSVVIDPETLENRTLRDYQISSVRKSLSIGRGIIEAATGSGKTEMAAATITHLRIFSKCTAIYLVPTVPLMDQTAEKLENFGLGPVCRVGGGRRFKEGFETYVFVVDSAYSGINRRGDIAECIANADILILDEAHHASAQMWIEVCEHCQARYRFAYTATAFDDPKQYSYQDLVLIGLVGPIIYEIRSKQLRERGWLADPLVTMLNGSKGRIPVWDWHTVYEMGIVRNKSRNSMIISLAGSCYRGGYKVMIFINRKKHGHKLAKHISSLIGCECVFTHGDSTVFVYQPSGSVQRHRWRIDRIADYVNNSDRAVLITTTVLDEGVDIPLVHVLIMGTGMRKYRRTIQRSGRGMRPKPGKNIVYIFDFVDTNHPYLNKQSNERVWTYEEEEFNFSDSLRATEESMGIELSVDRGLLSRVEEDERKEIEENV